MGPFKTAGGFVAVLIGAVALIAGLSIGAVYLTSAISSATAEPRGKTAVRENTQANGAFRVATYEDFFNLCASAQTAEGTIKNLEDELKTSPSADRVERINASLTAVKNARVASINEYNVKASEEHRAAFLSNNLPYTLSVNNEETQCVA